MAKRLFIAIDLPADVTRRLTRLVAGFVLYASTLASAGAVHTAEERFPLA